MACLDPALARADPATAEALFREGRQLLEAGQYAAACQKLAESQRQDPASGTLINLALCYELDGKLATAWALYRSAASLARQDGRADRQASAERKAAALESRVPRLLLRMNGPVPRDLVVHGPNGPLGAAALGSSIPVDPGSYAIRVTAAGYREWTAEVVIREGESSTLEIPTLVALAPSAPAAAAPVVVPPSSAPAGAVRRSSERALLFGVGGVSLAALGIGSYFGLSSLSAYARAEDACPSHRGCSSRALSERDSAETKAWIANVSFGVGLLGVAAGTWLLLRPHEANSVSVAATWLPGGGAIAVAARR
ncbi:MAG: hypothetical protein QM756_09320 [Polyangiaceae bacterium]